MREAELRAIALIVAAALLAAAIVHAAAGSAAPPIAAVTTPAPVATSVRPTPVPSVVPGPLDGLPTPRGQARRRPVAVVVDNYFPDARPQAGLQQASIVFDALTEDGVTRFLALYLEHDAANAGPIRSARPYFVDWAAGFQALLLHAGGSPKALLLVRNTPQIVDMDALKGGSDVRRLASRVAPHNLYANISALGKSATPAFAPTVTPGYGLSFKPAAGLPARGRASTIRILFSTPSVSSAAGYAVTYRYRRSRNDYLRFSGGVPFRDAASGRQISTANVVALTEPATPIAGDPLQRISIGDLGTGPAVVFNDGHAYTGRWSKPSAGSPLRLLSPSGSALRLVPGQTWIEIVPPGGLLSGHS